MNVNNKNKPNLIILYFICLLSIGAFSSMVGCNPPTQQNGPPPVVPPPPPPPPGGVSNTPITLGSVKGELQFILASNYVVNFTSNPTPTTVSVLVYDTQGSLISSSTSKDQIRINFKCDDPYSTIQPSGVGCPQGPSSPISLSAGTTWIYCGKAPTYKLIYRTVLNQNPRDTLTVTVGDLTQSITIAGVQGQTRIWFQPLNADIQPASSYNLGTICQTGGVPTGTQFFDLGQYAQCGTTIICESVGNTVVKNIPILNRQNGTINYWNGWSANPGFGETISDALQTQLGGSPVSIRWSFQ